MPKINTLGSEPIRTDHDPKPGPTTKFDWSATFDSYEPDGPIGYGPTEQAAVIDLLEQSDE